MYHCETIRIVNILLSPVLVDAVEDIKEILPKAEDLEFENVKFGYLKSIRLRKKQDFI